MAYCSVTDVKQYLGTSGTGDNELIETLINSAQSDIDEFTQRTFEASTNTTRYFDAVRDTDGLWLFLDEDLVSINTITNNADAASPEMISASEYITNPRNQTPYFAIKLLSSSDKYWDYTNDSEMGIEISGKWAYSETAPNDIKQACIRLAAFMYRQKDAQVFDVTAIPDAGVITIPVGIPADVAIMLRPYRKII